MKAIEVQDLADLAEAERDAERLARRLGGLVAVGALPAGVVDLARHLEDALAGACIQAGV